MSSSSLLNILPWYTQSYNWSIIYRFPCLWCIFWYHLTYCNSFFILISLNSLLVNLQVKMFYDWLSINFVNLSHLHLWGIIIVSRLWVIKSSDRRYLWLVCLLIFTFWFSTYINRSVIWLWKCGRLNNYRSSTLLLWQNFCISLTKL